MRPFEWLSCAAFAALALAAFATRGSAARQLGVALASAAAAAGIAAVSLHADAAWRQWMPHLYLVLGYWLPALLVRAPGAATRFERWLVRNDDLLRPRLPRLPRPLRPVAEIAYLFCYPLVPLSCAVVWTHGTPAEAERFWSLVLSSAFACYGTLPWLVSRPPRLLHEPAALVSRAAAVNTHVLGRVSHRLNTFPSGHAAVSCACAIALLPVSSRSAAIVGLVAAAVAIGAVAGRYHYVMDVVAGMAVAALLWGLMWLAG
jgi:membrane-associated phospholipid phosphatase